MADLTPTERMTESDIRGDKGGHPDHLRRGDTDGPHIAAPHPDAVLTQTAAPWIGRDHWGVDVVLHAGVNGNSATGRTAPLPRTGRQGRQVSTLPRIERPNPIGKRVEGLAG